MSVISHQLIESTSKVTYGSLSTRSPINSEIADLFHLRCKFIKDWCWCTGQDLKTEELKVDDDKHHKVYRKQSAIYWYMGDKVVEK